MAWDWKLFLGAWAGLTVAPLIAFDVRPSEALGTVALCAALAFVAALAISGIKARRG